MNMGMADALSLAAAVACNDLNAYVTQRQPGSARWVRIIRTGH